MSHQRRANTHGVWSKVMILLFLVQLLCQMTKQTTTEYYTAAVVEFQPTYIKANAEKTLQNNAQMYEKYIAEAKQQDVDIIVFPEDSLTTLNIPESENIDLWTTVIPNAEEEYVPCTGNRSDVGQTLKQLSCAAMENKIYVVINIAERKTCQLGSDSNCSFNGTRYYNSNVAFDRTGKIIARYRKTHLINETAFSVTNIPEIITFDTDFGVKFGTFICFDILFPVPALNLTRLLGVTNIIYPNAWFSEVPFLTAIQTQFAWAYAENVNLLSAGYYQPEIGCTGSGIYLGRDGIANATFTINPKHRLLISRVPKTRLRQPQTEKIEKPLQEAYLYYEAQQTPILMNGIGMMRDNITEYNHLPINGKLNSTICHQEFCCNFEVNAAQVDSPTKYRAVIFKGGRLFSTDIKTGIRVCAVVQCSNDSLVSCTAIDPSETEFTVLKISTTFDDHSQLLVTPTTLSSSMLPFEQWTYTEKIEGNRKTFVLTLNKPTKNLSAFAIYVRDFTRDEVIKISTVVANSASPVMVVSFASILMSFLSLYTPWR